MPATVIAIPEKVQRALGDDATRELVDLINQVAATNASTKVDKSEYDMHAALIEEKFDMYTLELDKFREEMKSMLRGGLLAGLAWTTVLIFGLFGALYSTLK